MNRADLEKLSKEELIEMIITQHNQLQALILKMAELEARLNMNSNNSSKPPSNDTWKKLQPTHQKTDKKPGGQPRHKGHGLKIQKQPDKTITHKPQQCKHCQTNLIK